MPLLSDTASLPGPEEAEIQSHPLWRHALALVASDAPEWLVNEVLVEQEHLCCTSACILLVTDQGRLVCQQRRQGLQHFGGGRICSCLLSKLHSARRELLMEANFDVATNRAVKWISNPVLCTVSRPRGSSMVIAGYREEIRTCLMQVCVIRDEEVSVRYGVMSIGGVEMWSRETAWVARQHQEASPSVKREWGQFFYGTPIFRLWSPDSTEFSYEAFFREWRHEDAQSI